MSLKAAIVVTLSYVFFPFVTLSVFYNLYDEIVVNYFAHVHTRYTRPPFSSRPGIKASIARLLLGGALNAQNNSDWKSTLN